MKERKKELRKRIARKKTEQSAYMLNALSDIILERLESHPAFLNAHTIMLYHSLEDEVHTHNFIKKWSTQKRIILPVVVGDKLELRYFSGQSNLATGVYGINEPTGEAITDYSVIDLVIVPGVAFTIDGWRLGRGKGYYDKLLPHIPAYKIGICFPFQLVDNIPTDKFDVQLNEVITSEK